MNPTARPSNIAIARIVRTRGNRGEVLAELHTDFPLRFRFLKRVWVEFSGGQRKCLTLEDCWEHKGRQVMKFSGVDSIGAAEELVGAWIEVEAGQEVQLPENTFWDHDLVGCSIRNTDGEILGTVTGVMRIAGNSQLVVEGESGEFLVPVAASICLEISMTRREIVVDLPQGLVDLNR